MASLKWRLHLQAIGHILAICWALSPANAQSEENMVEYTIVEEQPVNTLIGNIITDTRLHTRYDQATLEQFTFHFLSPSSAYKSLFEIEETTGLLRTAQSINRDQICARSIECDVHLDISIRPVKYFQILKVTIHILDINDNWPTFPEDRISLMISETTMPGATFAISGAEDSDSGSYSIQGYRLRHGSGSEKFGLQVTNSTDGSIDVHLVLKSSLDRESEGFYSLQVVAWDGGIPQKSGTVNVDVTVMDANDNIPRFNNSTYEVSVFENVSPGTTIAKVMAIDPDQGDNAEITYSFNRNTENQYGDIFGIRHATGEVYIKSEISFEERETYHLGLVANDQGPNSLAAYAKLVVHVWDVNDHAPKITVNTITNSGHAQIAENADVGAFVAHISVVDLDSGTNGQFSCTMTSEHFQLQKLYDTEFKIVTTDTFDRETKDQYYVNLMCHDKGNIPQTANERILIKVEDENDHNPVFPNDLYTVLISENNNPGDPMIKMNVTDADIGENAEIQWSIHSMNDYIGTLDINPDSGLVTTNVVFDHEKHEEYKYVIVATDRGTPSRSATATLSVVVKDVNDEPPKFPQKSYTFGTFENQAANTEIGIVTAYDADNPPFNEVTYILDPSRSASETFSIHPLSGKITARKSLDREQNAEYHFVVIAKNYGFSLSSTVNITVHVADKNDNAPRISFPSDENHTVEIPSVARYGDIITRVIAKDLDIGINAGLTYSIPVGNEDKLFDVNPMTGSISVNSDLRNRQDETFPLTILVQDSGLPQLSSIAEMDIFVNGSAAAAQIYRSPFINDNFLIIITATIFAVVLVVGVIVLLLLLRRRRQRLRQQHKYNCRVEATKVLMAANEERKGNMLKNNIERDSLRGSSKKEVTFSPDTMRNNGYVHQPSWPSVLDPALMQNPSAHSTVLGTDSLSKGSTDGSLSRRHPNSRPSQLPVKDYRFREEPRHKLLYHDQRKPIPKDCTLTEMQLQVHDMLQMMQQDQGSDRGSLTDSGRGASEEGDVNSRPSPMDTSATSPVKTNQRNWKQRAYPPTLAVTVDPQCPKHGKLAQSRTSSFNPPSKGDPRSKACACTDNVLCHHNPTSRQSNTGPGWPNSNSGEVASFEPVKNCVQSITGQYLSPEDALSRREADSVDGMSDSGTTTSGSYVVDLDEVEMEDGPQISADIMV